MSNRKKIDYIFVTNSLTGGGAERAINIAVNELQDNGISVGLIPINSGNEDLITVKVPVFNIDRQWLGGPLSIAMAYLKLYFTLITTRPKVVVLNCDLPEFLVSLIFGPWKLVVVEHAPKPWSSRTTFGRIIRRILDVRKANWVVVSDHLSIWGVKNANTVYIPNAIVESKSEISSSHIAGNNLTRLVFIGRLTKAQKQPQILLEVAKQVNLPILYIGDGLYASELKNIAEQLNIDATFIGHVSDPWGELEIGDLLLVPSAWEGDGLVAVEAMLKSVPLLLSDIADFRRFNLPDRFYCERTPSFSSRIEENINNLQNLVTDRKSVTDIISARTPSIVAMKWEEYLRALK